MAVEPANGSSNGHQAEPSSDTTAAGDVPAQDAATPAAQNPVTRRIVKLTEETINRIAAGEASLGIFYSRDYPFS